MAFKYKYEESNMYQKIKASKHIRWRSVQDIISLYLHRKKSQNFTNAFVAAAASKFEAIKPN